MAKLKVKNEMVALLIVSEEDKTLVSNNLDYEWEVILPSGRVIDVELKDCISFELLDEIKQSTLIELGLHKFGEYGLLESLLDDLKTL